MSGANRSISARGDDINARFRQLGRMSLELCGSEAITSRIDCEVLPLDETEPPQLIQHCDVMRGIARARPSG